MTQELNSEKARSFFWGGRELAQAIQVTNGGVTARQLRNDGATVHGLRSVGFSDAEITAAGFKVFTLQPGLRQPTGQVSMSMTAEVVNALLSV